MAIERKSATVDTVTQIVAPVAQRLELDLWDIRYEKEGGSWYLRIFIDKPGGVTIEDCENLSRAVDPLIDEADPIPGSYFLEVSSPGIERELVRPAHFEAYRGAPVNLRLIRPAEDGARDFSGILEGCADGVVTLALQSGEKRTFELKQTAFVRLHEDYKAGGVQEI